jgi:hypothetical protein
MAATWSKTPSQVEIVECRTLEAPFADDAVLADP